MVDKMFPYVVFWVLMFGNGFCTNHSMSKNFLTMEYVIKMYKYPYENHTMLTDDGYHLTMSRIPVNLNKTCEKSKGTVVLHHGMVNNGIIFFYLGPDQSIGFALSDNCYDIWIPHTRGTRYSSQHVNLTTNDRAFWDFSYDELAKYDIKVILDYVLKKTNESKIHFIGFSQGATQILMFLTENLEYEKYMASLQLIAPIAYMDNFTAYPENLPKEFLYTLTKTAPEIFNKPLPDNDYLFNSVFSKICEAPDGQELCSLFLQPITAPEDQTPDLNQKWAYSFPERVSFKTLAHYAQIHMSSLFQMYDYGPEQNLLRYGTKKPPIYHMENITTPISIYHAEGDVFSTTQSVNRLSKEIVNLKLKYFIDDSNWGHNNFVTTEKKEVAAFREKLLESLSQFS